MKKYTITILFLIFNLSTNLASSQPDSVYKVIYSWALNNDYSTIKSLPIDTSLTSFQIFNPVYKKNISNSYPGNLGSPNISNIYFGRNPKSDFLFVQHYLSYIHLPINQKYFNTKKPYTNISYTSGGPKKKIEQTLKFIHTQNVNENLNVGGMYNLLATEGQYQRQKIKNSILTFFSSYIRDKYSVYSNLNINKINAFENGGITEDFFIEDTTMDTETIPVYLTSAASEVNNKSFFVVQQYKFGNKILNSESDNSLQTDSSAVEQDSSLRKKISVMENSITHVFQYDKNYRKYKDDNPLSEFYEPYEIFIDSTKTQDKANFSSISNTFQWKLNKNFDDWNNFRLRILISNQLEKFNYRIPTDTIIQNNLTDTIISNTKKENFSNTHFGIGLNTDLRKKWNWNFFGKYFFRGYKKENFLIKTEINRTITEKNNFSVFSLYGILRKKTPGYFLNNYSSNHFEWKNQFEDVNEIIVKLKFINLKRQFEIGVNYSNIENFVYFDTLATPIQETSKFNIFSGYVYKNFVVWKFHFFNKIVHQTVDKGEVLRLPKLSLFNSTYFQQLIKFKITGGELMTQIGFNIYYNSKYFANAYMPATGQFYLQNEKKLGNYPYIDLFINIKLKRIRFFLKFAHVNSGLIEKKYFSVLHYPMNERTFKFGLLCTFYD